MSDAVDLDESGPSDVSAASARLLFILDITGSMSEELEACRGAMQGLVSMCSEQYLQDYAGQLAFAVITFTEDDDSGCHTSLYESTSALAVQRYMDKIILCRPPERPECECNGSDGPENHKVKGMCTCLPAYAQSFCAMGLAQAACCLLRASPQPALQCIQPGGSQSCSTFVHLHCRRPLAA